MNSYPSTIQLDAYPAAFMLRDILTSAETIYLHDEDFVFLDHPTLIGVQIACKAAFAKGVPRDTQIDAIAALVNRDRRYFTSRNSLSQAAGDALIDHHRRNPDFLRRAFEQAVQAIQSQ